MSILKGKMGEPIKFETPPTIDGEPIMFDTNNPLHKYFRKKDVIGSIVESGSNANGEWRRYADGTQIIFTTYTQQPNSIPLNNYAKRISYRSFVVDLPIQFIDDNYSGSAYGRLGNHVGWSGINTHGHTSSSVQVRFWCISGNTSRQPVYLLFLVGRWK